MNTVERGREISHRNIAGADALLSFVLRRERVAVPCWLAGIAVLLILQSTGSQRLYATPEKLAQLRATLTASSAVLAMSGPARLLDSVGGEIVFEIFAYLSVVAALMNMFLVVRHTRSDEETGRAELIRSARVGRRAPVVVALALAGLADCAVVVLVTSVAVVTGLPVGGSVLLGFALAGVGVVFAALTAVAVQIFENPRGVYGFVTLVIVAAYVLRAIGDVSGGAMSWASPIGWGQRSYPYVEDRWWPLLLFVAVAFALSAIAFGLLDRRDFGAGLLHYGRGRATASWAFGSPLGLAWRLHRGGLIGWAIGVFALGAAYGSFAESIEDYLADYPEIADYLPGGVADAVNSYLSLCLVITSLLAAAYGIAAALRARSEETAGRAELVLTNRVSRFDWLASHLVVVASGGLLVAAAGGLGMGLGYGLTISDGSQLPRVTAAALAEVPAIWCLVAVVALGIGWLPRAAAALAWSVYAYCVVGVLFLTSFDLPGWFDEASPFTHTPRAPLDTVTAAPMLIITALALAVAGIGLVGFQRRDAGY